MRTLAAAAAALLLWAAPAAAQTFPKFTGLVVDAANVLSPQTEADLTARLAALQRDTGRQLVVATVPDTQGYPIEDYGYRLGRAWGVGLKGVDNGAILFVAPGNAAGQRGPRLEVGRGLEPVLTDAFAESVVQGRMTPVLKQSGDVDRAMVLGTEAVIAQLRTSPEEAQARVDAAVKEFDRSARRGRSGGDGFPIALVFMLVAFAVLLVPLLLRRGRAGPGDRAYRRGGGGIADDVLPIVLWGLGNALSSGSRGGGGDASGGWGGGGFSGGGGGSFGGGGASGGW